jgi:hypothetical protein
VQWHPEEGSDAALFRGFVELCSSSRPTTS